MTVKHIRSGSAHSVQVDSQGDRSSKRTLPFKLPFRVAVELSSQLSHLSTGAGTFKKAAAMLRDAFAGGLVEPHHEEAREHVDLLENRCRASKDDPSLRMRINEALTALIEEFLSPTPEFLTASGE